MLWLPLEKMFKIIFKFVIISLQKLNLGKYISSPKSEIINEIFCIVSIKNLFWDTGDSVIDILSSVLLFINFKKISAFGIFGDAKYILTLFLFANTSE